MNFTHGQELIEMQRRLDEMGLEGLYGRVLDAHPVDSNPRHERIVLAPGGVVEIVQRMGRWWVLPPRRNPAST